jgi:hypothetical protein
VPGMCSPSGCLACAAGCFRRRPGRRLGWAGRGEEEGLGETSGEPWRLWGRVPRWCPQNGPQARCRPVPIAGSTSVWYLRSPLAVPLAGPCSAWCPAVATRPGGWEWRMKEKGVRGRNREGTVRRGPGALVVSPPPVVRLPACRSCPRPRPRGPLGVGVRSGTAEADPRRGSSQAGGTTGAPAGRTPAARQVRWVCGRCVGAECPI